MKNKNYTYLVNVTFYAGSDDPADVDQDTYVIKSNVEISEEDMKKAFKTTNARLGYGEEREESMFALTYADGLNIHTLMEGLELYSNVDGLKVEKPENICGVFDSVDNYYIIEQWQ